MESLQEWLARTAKSREQACKAELKSIKAKDYVKPKPAPVITLKKTDYALILSDKGDLKCQLPAPVEGENMPIAAMIMLGLAEMLHHYDGFQTMAIQAFQEMAKRNPASFEHSGPASVTHEGNGTRQ